MKFFPFAVCVLLFVTIDPAWSTAQTKQLNFTTYSSRQGLSSVIVYDIMLDSYGFLWLATDDGLNRFDGTNFKIYRNDPSNRNGLGVNEITSLHESKDGTIWIGTNGGGLSFYDRNKDSIFNYRTIYPDPMSVAINSVSGDKNGNVWVTSFGATYVIGPEKKLATGSQYATLLKAVYGKVSMCFLQDTKNRIWLGTGTGLYLFDPAQDALKLFQHEATDATSLPHNNVNDLAEDQQGNIWVATENGLAMVLPDGKGFMNTRRNSFPLKISSNNVYALAVGRDNRLWVGTDEGLDILDFSAKTASSYIPDNRDPNSLASRSIRSLFIDPKGISWVGTYRGGLSKYDENAHPFNLKEFNAFDPFGLGSPLVTSFAGYQNSVFIGTDGGGLRKYDRSTGLLQHINLPVANTNSPHDLSILALETDKRDQLWIGTFSNGLYWYNPANGSYKIFNKGNLPSDLNNTDIICLKADRKGNMWVGTNGGGINVVNAGNNQVEKYVNDPAKPGDPSRPTNNFIRCLEEDRDGRIWAGTFGGGISVLDPASKQFRFYTRENSDLPSNYVFAIIQDSRGNIWAGTSGNGIGLLKPGNDRFEAFTEKNGLANGVINKIIEDVAGKIWFSTNSGISCYDTASRRFTNYSTHDGLQSGSFIPGSGIGLADGVLFFGGQNGFNYFSPSLWKTNKNIPPVVLTDLRVDNQPVQPSSRAPIDRSIVVAEQIRLQYKQTFSIGFEALNFTVPEANQYQYRMEGFDKDWINAGKEHRAYYSSLPPGKYTFHVRASNNDDIWNQKGRSVQVLVEPPFWRTTFAYLLYTGLIAGLLWHLRRRGIRKMQMKFAIERERQEARQLIERQKKEAEYLHKLDQQKISFLTNLSHEFRTPISLIMGPVDTLISQANDALPLNQLNLIKRNSRRLLNLVNQLLDFRKMEEREVKLQTSEGDLVLFIKDVCDSFNDLAQRKRIAFGFHNPLSSLAVLFDHNKLERVLFNLLSNAFKFTPENGNVAVTLTCEDLARENDIILVTMSVKDSGIGIPQAAQERVFDSFFQHTTTNEVLNHGTGIGLSIAREFVNIHNGKLWVESEEGKGSSFIFQLPLRKVVAKSDEYVQAKDSSNGINRAAGKDEPMQDELPSILIVEDDEDFRSYIKDNLKTTYRIFEAADGKEGWQRTLFHHPDMIVCDIQMPIMNGLELVQKLKADKRTMHIPVVLLTAANTPGAVLDGLETGAIDYMSKPFDFAVLQAKIHNILFLNRSFKETYSKQVTVALPEAEITSPKEQFMQKALSFLYENLSNPGLSVEMLSSHLFMSRASLYNRLLEYTGMSPVEFIRSIKLEKSRELLEKTDMTINEIAFELGFANGNYFTKVFKKQYNITPSEFQARKGQV